MKAAAIQLCSGTDIDSNIAEAEALIRSAAAEGATLIVTPEMTHLLQRKAKDLFAAISTEENDRGVARFSALAQELRIYLLIGSLAIRKADASEDPRAANRSFLFGPDGAQLEHYDKIHLFDVAVSKKDTWTESRVYDRGQRAVMADVDGVKLGMSVCYDLRFPALYQNYAKAGAAIMSVPAAFTRPTGEAHWKVLLKARAIETSSFIIAPAQGGNHQDGRSTWGHSMIVGPWGEVRAELMGDQPGYICATLDMADVDMARRRIPAWQHAPDFTPASEEP